MGSMKRNPAPLSFVDAAVTLLFLLASKSEPFSHLQMPVILPESSTSIDAARETLGSPGMSIMLPEITTTNPAPAESDALVTFRVQPLGAPSSLGLSDREYWVFAMQTGSFPYPQSENCFSFAPAASENFTPSAP